MESKKIKFIPGWMDQSVNFPQYDTLDIWRENIRPDVRIEADIIVAHSLGCHFTLFNWKNMEGKKIIFINPLVVKRNYFSWFWRWIKTRSRESHPKDRQYVTSPAKIIRGIFYFFKFLGGDAFQTLKGSGADITVIRGKDDLYFCDYDSCRALSGMNIPLIEIDGVGHLWNKKIDDEIRKIVGE